MNSYQRENTGLNTKVDSKESKSIENDLKNLWDKYNQKGERFNDRDYDHYMSLLRQKYNDEEYVENIGKRFMTSLNEVKKIANKVVRNILKNYNTVNLNDAELYDISKKYQKKYELSRSQFDAIYQYLKAQALENPSPVQKRFNFKVPKKNSIGKALGYVSFENLSSFHIKDDEKEVLQAIMKLNHENIAIHSQVIEQTLRYQDLDYGAISGQYVKTHQNPYVYIHPVIAALFLPKIKKLEEVMLLTDIGNIIATRYRNEPIQIRTEYELFYNMIHDPNDSVCDPHSAIKDMLKRYHIQLALWSCVLNLRMGKYYHAGAETFILAIDNCRFTRYDAPDLFNTGDEGDICRRLFSTFSFRPITVKSIPINYIQPMISAQKNPFYNTEIAIGEIDEIPMLNVRLPLTRNYQTDPIIKISDKITSNEYFVDPLKNYNIPKQIHIIGAGGVFVVYVPRRTINVNSIYKKAFFQWDSLPVTSSSMYELNTYPINYEDSIKIGNEEYKLRSVVCAKYRLEESKDKKQTRIVVNGCDTMIKSRDTGDFFCYDPLNVLNLDVNKANLVDPSGKPIFKIRQTPLHDTDLECEINRIQYRGCLYVYVNDDESSNYLNY